MRITRSSQVPIAAVAAVLLSGCTTITSLSPDPATVGALVRVDVSNDWGAGIELDFNGSFVDDFAPGSDVEFTVPGLPAGSYEVKVKQPLSFMDFITIVGLFRDREDTAQLQVQ